MNQKMVRTITLGSLVLIVALITVWQALAQDAKTPYPNMAPLDQYMMDRDAGDCSGTKCGSALHFQGRHGYGSRNAWL